MICETAREAWRSVGPVLVPERVTDPVSRVSDWPALYF